MTGLNKPDPDWLAPKPLDSKVLISMAAGLVGALIVFWLPLFGVMFHGMVTLIHEMGHAAAAWILARPAVPAFDFNFGGGITGIFDRSNNLLILIYGIFAWLIYAYRKNGPAMYSLIALAALHAFLIFSRWDTAVITAMGHGFELVIATVFLYRGWSGASVINPLERPLYAALGQFIVMWDIVFAWKLFNSPGIRAMYKEGKGGIHKNDFDLIARTLHIELSTVGLLFLLCCFLPPIISFLAYRYQMRMRWVLSKLTETEP